MTCSISTAQGKFLAHFTTRGLARLQFPGTQPAPPVGAKPPPKPWLHQTRAAINSILTGKMPAKLPPLDLSMGTRFQQQLWHAMLLIPTGGTRTYGELAHALRRPNAARAIGQACGANPIPLIVPCHRVLANGNKLGGFSAGLDWKRKLLKAEGHSF
jgi:methylated-DNA-[protein]-cysteine S-methyltransferase